MGTQTPAPLLPGLSPRGELKSQPSLQEPKEQLALPEQAGASRGSESFSVSIEGALPAHLKGRLLPPPLTQSPPMGALLSSSALGHLALEEAWRLRLFSLGHHCDIRVPGCSLSLKHLYAAAD